MIRPDPTAQRGAGRGHRWKAPHEKDEASRRRARRGRARRRRGRRCRVGARRTGRPRRRRHGGPRPAARPGRRRTPAAEHRTVVGGPDRDLHDERLPRR
ncbi:hypothetical protein PP1_015825 [Pseudonocardia sp. P1]